MHCLIISTTAEGGSLGAAALSDAREALHEGFDVILATGRGGMPAALRGLRVRHIRIGGAVDAGVHYLLSRAFDGQGNGSVRATREFLDKIRNINPRRIIFHNLHGHYLNLPLFAEWMLSQARKGSEIIWRAHDFWPVTGHCAFLPAEGCPRFGEKCGCHDCPMAGAYPKTLIDRSAANYARKRSLLEPLAPYMEIRAVSRWQAELLKKSFLRKARITVRHPAIDPVYHQTHEAGPRAGFALAVAYPWQKYKGYNDLTAIRKALPQEMDFVVVGLDNKQTLRLSGSGIICVPRVKKAEELAWYYRQAGVFISPSYAETYGMAIREAAACGTPVVAYGVGGVHEGLEANPLFHSVPYGDAGSLAVAAAMTAIAPVRQRIET